MGRGAKGRTGEDGGDGETHVDGLVGWLWKKKFRCWNKICTVMNDTGSDCCHRRKEWKVGWK